MTTLDVKHQRLAMTDALMPPSGYRLGAAIGTTYSLDFDALTAVLLAFAGADCDDEPSRVASTLTGVARMRNRLRVLVDAAGIHATRPHRLYALFDRITRPVALRDTAFHPKVWALRFDPMQRPERTQSPELFRVLVTSRNLTDSRCWELATVVNGRAAASGSAFGADVAAFLKRVSNPKDLPAECWKLIEGLKRAEFEESREWSGGLRLRWQYPGTQSIEPSLPRRASRALVISPFVRADFLQSLIPRCDQLTLVSTQEELDALPEAAHTLLETVTALVVTDATDDELPVLDLHAKLVAWEASDGREMLLGSANATAPGWGLNGRANAEAMLSMKPGPSIADVVKAFVSPARGEYHPWIEEYRRARPEVDEKDEAQARLDRVKRAVCQDPVVISYDSAAETLTVRAGGKSVTRELPNGVRASLRPFLTTDLNDWRPYASLWDGGARFSGIVWDSVSAFVLVRLQDPTHADVELLFCLQGTLDMDAQMLDERDKCVNTRLLEGLDPRTLLLNVLEGLPAGSGLGPGGGTSAQGKPGIRFLGQATIERVMEACTADPGLIDEIDAVLRASEGTDTFRDFVVFWAEFRAALNEVNRHV